MKVLILTMGTRGDVQPFVALAAGLTSQGHEAVLAAPARFANFVRGHGVAFAALDDGPMRVLDTGTAIGEIATGGMRAKAALARRLPAMFDQVLDDCWTVAATGLGSGADVIVHNGQVVAGQHVAEKLAVPAVLGLPIPMYVPTREFPWPGQEFPSRLPRMAHRATYLGMQAPAMMFGRTVDRWRAKLGLPRRPGRHDPLRRPDGGSAPVLHAMSRHVLPRPDDWPATATMTGYWFLDQVDRAPAQSVAGATADLEGRSAGQQPGLPAELVAFLDQGEAPIFIGFGSMAGSDPQRTTSAVLAAVRRTGVRAVVGTSWGGLAAEPVPGQLFVLDEVPYELLFPQVAAVVHHGGAGTTAEAIRAGRPQIVCPFVADQPFWGRRMQALGVAPAPIAQRRLTTENLTAAVEAVVGNPKMAARAADLAGRVREERGVATAVRLLEEISQRR
ncbi:glycosyltransferase [Micromonospora sp. NPDC003197]